MIVPHALETSTSVIALRVSFLLCEERAPRVATSLYFLLVLSLGGAEYVVQFGG